MSALRISVILSIGCASFVLTWSVREREKRLVAISSLIFRTTSALRRTTGRSHERSAQSLAFIMGFSLPTMRVLNMRR